MNFFDFVMPLWINRCLKLEAFTGLVSEFITVVSILYSNSGNEDDGD